MRQFAYVLFLPLALSGCGMFSSNKVTPTEINISAPAEDPEITARLAEAAQRTATAVESLASVEQARTPELYTPIVSDAPAELRVLVTVAWTGPWEQLIKTLSERVGYQFQVIGKEPPTPVVVTVDARQQPFVDVLRNIGLQGAGRADLVLDSKNKVIEVRYAPDTGR
jgi:DotD protein